MAETEERKKQKKQLCLKEEDVPGASFQGKHPNQFHCDQLRRWLKCRGAKTTGNRVELLDRIKAYQNSGFDKNIVDPDGGIHRERLRQAASGNSKPGNSDSSCSRVEWPKDGWTCSLKGMPNFQHCFIFDHLSCTAEFEKENNKMRRGAFKSKRDGYSLFKAAHVQKVKFNGTSNKDVCFFESHIKASMTRNKSYRTMICLSKSTAKVRSGSCNCKAGVGGRCKHVGALLYTVLDYVESEATEIPQDLSCTEKPLQWNKPNSSVNTRGAVPIVDLLFTKHSYHDDKMHQKSAKRAARSIDRQTYSAAPSFATKVDKSQIKALSDNLKAIKTPSRPMLIDLLEGNSFEPSANVLIDAKEARFKVHQDHEYCLPTKRKLCFDSDQLPMKEQCTEQTILPGYVLGACHEPLSANFSETAVLSHCETVQTENFEVSSTPELQTWKSTDLSPLDAQSEIDINNQIIPTKSSEELFSDEVDLTGTAFKEACNNFVQSVTISDEEIKEIEIATRGQSQNEEWFKLRSGRVTASYFGEVNNRRPSTPPDRLVRDIFQYKQRVSPPQCLEGQRLEPIIKEKFISKQEQLGHKGLTVQEKGLMIDKTNPLLAASIDGEVHDPAGRHSTVGNLEMKYKQFSKTLDKFIDNENPKLLCVLADKKKGFCLENKNGILKLKKNHKHFAQVQGGMGVTGRPWSDFVVYTYYKWYEDIHIERIYFDPIYWQSLKAKLLNFCLFAIVPEILTQRVKRGKHLYPSLFAYK